MLMPKEQHDMCENIGEMPPFRFMERGMLKRLCRGMEAEQYAIGEEVPAADESVVGNLRVVQSGAIKRYLVGQNGELIPVDVLGPGDNFGFIQSLHEEYRKVKAIATEPTVCCMIPMEDVFAVLSEKPSLPELSDRQGTGGIRGSGRASAP